MSYRGTVLSPIQGGPLYGLGTMPGKTGGTNLYSTSVRTRTSSGNRFPVHSTVSSRPTSRPLPNGPGPLGSDGRRIITDRKYASSLRNGPVKADHGHITKTDYTPVTGTPPRKFLSSLHSGSSFSTSNENYNRSVRSRSLATQDRLSNTDELSNSNTRPLLEYCLKEDYMLDKNYTTSSKLKGALVLETKLDTPSHWSAMKDPAYVECIALSKSDTEYVQVEQAFSKSMDQGVHITKIERIQNATLYTQYQAKKKQMQTSCTTKNVEHNLWHGTAHAAVKSINAHGFNRSYGGKNATAFGQGVYFALSAAYSAQPTYAPPDASGHKQMYRCLVLTGDCTRGAASMRVLPPKDPKVPHILYDSVSDNPGSPGMFVIFNDTQAYPEHLITFK